MKTLFLIVAALLWCRVASAEDVVPTRDEWKWLGDNSWRALNALMPLDDPARPVVTYRTSRLVEYDYPERYFRITDGFAGRPSTAHVVAPVGKSLQPQLLELHQKTPNASLEALLPQLNVLTADFTETSCPGLRRCLAKLSGLKISVPSLDMMAVDPAAHRLQIRTQDGDIDATLFDSDLPLVRWARNTYEVLRGCANPAGELAKP